MRNYIKYDLLELVQTMKALCGEILQECARGNEEYLVELLEQGQQAAISMGETIEKFEGEGTEAVSALEVFCDYLYQFSQASEMGTIVVSKERKTLDRILLNIENGIRHLPVIYEIVFLPYKASMWDCMESIYLAAAKDPDCHVSVVPVPYFDVDNSRRLGQMHYEGSKFPEEVVITSWETYHLAERRPDIAYIHNPFDGCNLVTSVHPNFYSDKLKEYTAKLVYVSYALSRETVPDSHLYLPVYRNIDYMVIQARRYEKCYKDKSLEGKMLPLGSPKFDRVIQYQEKGVRLPDEWKEVLQDRIRFFYNTSLSSLLQDTEAALRKMEYVFHCFERHKDAALIWRPHPLMETTLQSMRPQYLGWYHELVQYFVQKNIGVFDQTADVDKTIVLSGAYIGENTSSVMDLFCVTGKPLFILNISLRNPMSEVEYCDALFCNVAACVGKYWTFSYQFNALCTLDMDTGKLHIIDAIPGYQKNQGALVSNVYSYQGKLILSPNCMDSIVEYDVETGKFCFIKLPNAFPSGNMGSIYPFGEDFIIMPVKYPAIVQYSTQKKQYIYHRRILEDVRKCSEGKEFADGRGYFGGGMIKDGCWYLTLPQTNAVLIWHMDTLKYEIIHMGDSEDTYYSIADVKDGFLLRQCEGMKLLFWNPESGQTRKIEQFPEAFQYRLNPREEVRPFDGFWMAKDHLLLVPQLGNQFLEIDRETLEISVYEMDWKNHIREEQEGIFNNQWGNFRRTIFTDWNRFIDQDYSKIAFVTAADGVMLMLDIDTHQYTEVQTGYEYDELKKLFPVEELYEKFEIPIKSWEDRYYTLDDFINAMAEGRIPKYNSQQQKVYSEYAANLDGSCGEKVHKAVKKSLQ